MAKQDKIIEFLDRYLEDTGLPYVEAPEANKLLSQVGLLKDSSNRPGLPLRKLLREGGIPHSYQEGARWRIPHFSKINSRPGELPRETIEATDQIRLRYKPQVIKVLLVGESPPAGGTFFYNGNSNLYRATVKSFTMAFEKYFPSSVEFFKFLVDLQIYLDDLCTVPVNHFSTEEREITRDLNIESLSKRIADYEPNVVICIMRAIETHVKGAINKSGVSQIRFYSLPFPSYKNNQLYVGQLAEILKEFYNR